MSEREKAHIKIAPETRDTLRAAKVGAETYDDVINRLLEGDPLYDDN